MLHYGRYFEPFSRASGSSRDFQEQPGTNWVPWSADAGIHPTNAVRGGTDSDGSEIYIGRASHCGHMLPAKVIPIRRVAYVSYDGIEYSKPHFEVLCGLGYTWVPNNGEDLPKGAVLSGTSNYGEPFYIGRAHHDGSITPGRINRKDRCVYVPFGGYEHAHSTYEILVDTKRHQKQSVGGHWQQAHIKGAVPAGALLAGYDSDGSDIYLGRVYRYGMVLPAKVMPRKKMCHVGDEGLEFEVAEYEALCNANVSWVPFRGVIPMNAVVCGEDRIGGKMYFGRGRYEGSLTPGKVIEDQKLLKIPYNFKEIPLREFDILVDNSNPSTQCIRSLDWQKGSSKSTVPKGAVLAGHDTDGSPIYLARVMFEGNQLPAKVIPRRGLCRTSHSGKAIEVASYEALCNAPVSWVPFRGTIPAKAIVCGRTLWGETVYFGRGHYKGSLTPGKVLEHQKVLKIPYDWNEFTVRDFEILVEY
ncbi:uncharacterized protein LOC129755267 [Uranotaenia lowii]|uniref:uncharacterized protein LOC129755267 n=1 Tax=Uranotaenia lowii TaxID=190385 RepID=UPI002478F7A2|nr:uncharacterized protein LOC129755267 [Uranotaenia lowii]